MTNGDIAATITASSGKSASQSGPSVMQKCYGISSYESNAMKSQNPSSGIYEADKARTLDTSGGKPAPDSKRYKAIGNGMAHPCASFVLAQIVKAERG